jgi:hypothetical protein
MNKQVEMLFDMIHFVQNHDEGATYPLNTKSGIVQVPAKKVQAFVARQVHDFSISGYDVIENRAGKKLAVQAFTGTSDIADIDTNVWNAFQEVPESDLGWQQAFRGVPLKKGQLRWSIGNVTAGTVWKELVEGEKVQYRGITGDKIYASVKKYGAGLSIDWETIEGKDLAAFYNELVDFKSSKNALYADIHYGLLATAAANEVIDYQLTATESILSRDIATLNLAYDTIGRACKDLGMGDTANAQMLVYAQPELRGRIDMAIAATSSDVVASGDISGLILTARIKPVYTFNEAIVANKFTMVLPKNKIQNSVYMMEKSFPRINPDNLDWIKSAFTAFGGIVGENAQTARGDMSD